MTIAETNLLHERAKDKKDGVYSFRGNLWAVKNGRFLAFVNYRGECYQRMGSFNFQIGKVEHWDRRKKLTQWLKEQ